MAPLGANLRGGFSFLGGESNADNVGTSGCCRHFSKTVGSSTEGHEGHCGGTSGTLLGHCNSTARVLRGRCEALLRGTAGALQEHCGGTEGTTGAQRPFSNHPYLISQNMAGRLNMRVEWNTDLYIRSVPARPCRTAWTCRTASPRPPQGCVGAASGRVSRATLSTARSITS